MIQLASKTIGNWVNTNNKIFTAQSKVYTTRLEHLTALQSALILLFIGSLIFYSSFFTKIQSTSELEAINKKIERENILTDIELYKSIIKEVSNGENYYSAAIKKQRENHFPVVPFITVRPPFLALLFAKTGFFLTELAQITLICAVIITCWNKLRFLLSQRQTVYAIVLIASSSAITIVGTYFHDSWAGLLIALSLSLRTPKKYYSSVLFGIIAALFRELAICYLILMAASAFFEKKWTEVFHWLLAICFIIFFLLLHYYAVQNYILPKDPVSQGWNGLGGLDYYLHTVYSTTIMASLPVRLGYGCIPLCVFGWLVFKSEYCLRVFGLILGYSVLVMFFARQENFYWSFLVSPLLTGGIVFAVIGINKLISNIFSNRF